MSPCIGVGARRLSTLLCTSFVLLTVPGCGLSHPRHGRQPEAPIFKAFTLPFMYHERGVYVEGHVNGIAALLLLDTGANRSALDSTFAVRAGVAVTGRGKVEGTAGTIDVLQGSAEAFRIGDATIPKFAVTIQSLGGLLRPDNRPVDGILGSDFLKTLVVQIDYESRRLVVSAGGRSSVQVADRSCVEMRLDDGIPQITGMLNDSVRADLRLDTGASLFASPSVWINVPMHTWDSLRHRDGTLSFRGYLEGTGVGGKIKLGYQKIRSLHLGDIRIDEPYVIVQPAQGYFARPNAVGFVSNNLLEKYSPVVLDYRSNRLCMTRR